MKVDFEQWEKKENQNRVRALKWWNGPHRGQAKYFGLSENKSFRAESPRRVRESSMKDSLDLIERVPKDGFNTTITMVLFGEVIDFYDKESAREALLLASVEVKRNKIRTETWFGGYTHDLPRITVVEYDQPLLPLVTAPAYISGGCCCDGETAIVCVGSQGETLAVLFGSGYSHEAASGGTMGMYSDPGTVYTVPEGTVALVEYSADTIDDGRRSAKYLRGDRKVANKAIDAYMASGSLWWEKGQIPAETLLVEEKV
jgi:hypothetical protein